MTHEEHLIETYGKTQAAAMLIVEIFEDLLDEHKIVIPNDDRTGAEGEAPLYGTTYWNLIDDVKNVLYSYIDE
jgi:hypothetical protein